MHVLTYLYKGGIHYDHVLKMSRQKRQRFIRRITKQKQDEAEAIRKAGDAARRGRR